MPFGIGQGSVLPGDPPVRVGHSGTRGAKQEGAREDTASASGGKRVPCLKLAAVGRVEHAGQLLSGKAASSTLASLSSFPNTPSLPKHKHAISS